MPASPFSALHDLSSLAASLAPLSPPPVQPMPIPTSIHSPHAHAHAHAHSSHSPSSASYSSTPSLSPYDPALPSSYTSTAASYVPPPSLPQLAGAKQGTKHRRQSSSNHRRRLSDARESLARPFIHVDSTPPPSSQSLPAPSFMRRREGKKEREGKEGGRERDGKRIYTCEECHKVYRHRSCMDKHRWEHSPHWLPSSKFLLSKHQQVQLLEAAAILSHLPLQASSGRSLPEDRALWPAYLSALRTDVRAYGGYGDGASSVGTEDMEGDVEVGEDEETEDEIEVVRGWEGVGGMEMEL